MGAEVFIAVLPDVELDANGARLTYTSSEITYCRRYPPGLWRQFLEREIRRLNEYDDAERARGCVIKGRFGEG